MLVEVQVSSMNTRRARHAAKLNRIDPQAWLADVLRRLPDHPARRIDDLLPWNWTQPQPRQIAA